MFKRLRLLVSMCLVMGFIVSMSVMSYAVNKAPSTAPDAANIVIVNQWGAGTVTVSGLTAGDKIIVYKADGTTVLGNATVAAGKNDVTYKTTKLDVAGSSVQVSVTSTGKAESPKTSKTYSAVDTTTTPTLTGAGPSAKVVVTNNPGAKDTVYVTGLSEKDIVNVYSDSAAKTLLKSATVAAKKTSVSLSLAKDLGDASGSIYITVKNALKQASAVLTYVYSAAPQNTTLTAITNGTANSQGTSTVTPGSIQIVHYSETAGLILVTGINPLDVVKVYSSDPKISTTVFKADSGAKTVGTGTVKAGKHFTWISLSRLATGAGTVYVTVKSPNKYESVAVAAAYTAEPDYGVNSAPELKNGLSFADAAADGKTVITLGDPSVKANTFKYKVSVDTSAVPTPNVGDDLSAWTAVPSDGIITAANGKHIGVAEVDGTGKAVQFSDATSIAIDGSGTGTGTGTGTGGGGVTTGTPVTSVVVYGAQGITYIAEAGGTLQMSATATPPTATDRTITWSVVNGTGKATINSSGLLTAVANGTVTVKATNPASGVIGTRDIDIQNQPIVVESIAVTAAGSATTITTANGTLQMSADVQPSDAADKTIAWTVTNGTGTATISTTGLLTALTNGTVTVRATNASTGVYGTLNITLSNQPAAGPLVSQIYTYNGNLNEGHPDIITVSGLNAGDVVKVYDAAFGGNIVTSGTVASGKTSFSKTGGFVFPSIGYDDGGTQGGTVYVSVTPSGGTESACTAKDYLRATYSSLILDTSHVTNIINNKPGMNDTFTVTGVSGGSVIRAYSYQLNSQAVAIETLAGTTTVPDGQTSVNMSVPEIGPDEGWLRVTQQAPGQEESDKYVLDTINSPKDFISSQTPIALTYCLDNVGTRNYTSATDELWISNTPVGYVVKVYRTATGNDCFDTFTITSETPQMFNLSQDLGTDEGDIYITLTKSNLTESNRIIRPYNQATESGQ